jgi:hypothetical protein
MVAMRNPQSLGVGKTRATIRQAGVKSECPARLVCFPTLGMALIRCTSTTARDLIDARHYPDPSGDMEGIGTGTGTGT